ncbi:hypothetical protein GWK47_050103 [Chionoecetes opilio]|uniref:Uncharacterized protein n=1 Tax=Chionoecetes opilio TaxID=41210 RepID=A0A8J4YE36_CHIOP|nr:hypothetical protein GWK47_050103 [Chionoecetes opilio]
MRSKQSIKEGRSLPAHQTQLLLSPQLNLLPLGIIRAVSNSFAWPARASPLHRGGLAIGTNETFPVGPLTKIAAVALTALVVVQAVPEPYPDLDPEALPDPAALPERWTFDRPIGGVYRRSAHSTAPPVV